MTTEDSKIWQQFRVLYGEIENVVGRQLLSNHGLGLSEYRALEALSEADGSELRMQELAESVGLHQSSVTRLVSRMKAQQLTYRDLCLNDKRGVYTVLSDSGRTKYLSAKKDYERYLREALHEVAKKTDGEALVRDLSHLFGIKIDKTFTVVKARFKRTAKHS
jgi:DNA-binding MarR family transcriptional regulator